MNRIFASCALLVLSITAALARPAQVTLKVVYFNYPPHIIVDKFDAKPGAPKGAAVDVWEQHIGPKAGVKIEWIGPLPFPRALAMMESGEADAITLLAKSPERERKYVYAKQAHIEGIQGLMVPSTDRLNRVTHADELSNKLIGLLGGGTYMSPFFTENQDRLHFESIPGEDAPLQTVKKIIGGRIEAGYFTFPDVLLYYAAKEKSLSAVKVIPYPGSESKIQAYPVMSKKLDPAIARKIDEALSAVRANYDYRKMSGDYIKRAAQ